MFLIFNIDDMFDGMSAGVGMILKLAIIVGIITPPLMFLEGGDWLAIVLPILVFSIIACITNIVTLIKSIKLIANRRNTRKVRIQAFFVMISIILLSILGLCYFTYYFLELILLLNIVFLQ